MQPRKISNDISIESKNNTKKEAKKSKQDYVGFVKNLHDEDHSKFNDKMDEFYKIQKNKESIGKKSTETSIADFLNNNLVIGEKHSSVSAKNFLINNMKLLKDNGFDTLFLEGFCYDYQSDLDVYDPKLQYLTNKAALCAYKIIEAHDFKKDPFKKRNTHVALIGIAKQLGIRVVGIDSAFTLNHTLQLGPATLEGYRYRLKSMNYVAYHIINKEVNDNSKWVMLTGAYHTKTVKGIPGIADLTKANTIIIEECKNEKKAYNQINFNQDYKTIGKESTQIEALITLAPQTEAPLLTSIPESMSQKQVGDVINNYNHYKNQFFGIRKLNTSKETKQVINDLTLAKNDKERFFLSQDYLKNNSDNAFAQELREVLWSRKKCA